MQDHWQAIQQAYTSKIPFSEYVNAPKVMANGNSLVSRVTYTFGQPLPHPPNGCTCNVCWSLSQE